MCWRAWVIGLDEATDFPPVKYKCDHSPSKRQIVHAPKATISQHTVNSPDFKLFHLKITCTCSILEISVNQQEIFLAGMCEVLIVVSHALETLNSWISLTLAFQRYQPPEKVLAAEMILIPVFRNLEATYLPLGPGKRPRKLRGGERHLDLRSSLGLAARMGCRPVFQAQSPYLRPWDERHVWIASTWSVGLHCYSVLLFSFFIF